MKFEKYIEIRHTIRDIIKGSIWEGHVFVVGGCVRDELMGNEIKDIDMCIDLPGGGVKLAKWLHCNKLTTHKPVTYPTYGTAMFHLRAFPDVELECVQTRKEKYPDSKTRNPETAFGCIEDDCFRRDLTINALYRNISTDELLDLTGKGVEDIKNHVIRTTTEPDIIFDDDPLRILRCIRFATRYGWDMEQSTYQGILKNVSRLEIITHERIRDEFDKMLTCKHPVQAMNLLRYTGAMHYVVPEMEATYNMTQGQYHFGTVWEHTLKTLEMVQSSDSLLRVAAFLHDIGKTCTREVTENGAIHFIGHEKSSAGMTDLILRRLKYPNDFIRQVQFLIGHHMDCKSWKDDLSLMKPKHLRKLQFVCKTEDVFQHLLLLIDADNKSHAKKFCLENQVGLILKRTEEMKREGSAMFDYHLPFTGTDVMQLKNLKPGPAVKECLDYLMKLAFVNPLRPKEDWIKHLKGYK